MKVGFVGLGKLGLPCALVAAHYHDVVGTDVSDLPRSYIESGKYPHMEEHVNSFLSEKKLRFVLSVEQVVQHADIVFVAIQTPHAPLYEGITRLPPTRSDFDYTYLVAGVREIAETAKRLEKSVILVVISTVLPGTTEREIVPFLNDFTKYVYNPFFIAMGTTITDYMYPEFILIGSADTHAASEVRNFYSRFVFVSTIPSKPRFVTMGVKSAELTKVLYNSFIGMKLALANTSMVLCDELNVGRHNDMADCDDVMGALCLADRRLISPAYLKPGMGDGGMCHPRDGIAMSYLSTSLHIGFDLFGDIMKIRERQTAWIASKVMTAHLELETATRKPAKIVLLGRSFKSESNITTGSCAELMANIIREFGVDPVQYDPVVDGHDSPTPWEEAAVFVVATDHKLFRHMQIPRGSIVIDPWGTAPERDGVTLMSLGRAR